jgi:hypothetical protein
MRKRKRGGSRGENWERLEVSFNVVWPSKEIYDSLTPTQRRRAKLTALLDALEGKENALKLSRLSWANPDASHYPPTARGKAIRKALPTLNRGKFLSRIVSHELERLGGRFTVATQPPVERKKRAKRKTHRTREALARLRAKRHRPRHPRKIRRHRGVSRKR